MTAVAAAGEEEERDRQEDQTPRRHRATTRSSQLRTSRAHRGIQHVGIDPQAVLQVAAGAVGVQILQVAEEPRRVVAVAQEALLDQLRRAQDAEAGDVDEVVLGIVLHGPERTPLVRDVYSLHRREAVAGEDGGAGAGLDDVVLVAGEGVEHRRLAGEHRVRGAGGGERDLARDAELAAARVGGAAAAGGGDRDVHRPAAAEARHAGGEGGAAQLEVLAHRLRVAMDGEVGAGPDEAIVAGERRRQREAVGLVRGDVDRRRRRQRQQQAPVELAGQRRAGAAQGCPAGGVVGVDDEQPRLIAAGRRRS
ncbi:MAG: hypothetical protein U0802_18410 [Candidatus Binatia bacterium]